MPEWASLGIYLIGCALGYSDWRDRRDKSALLTLAIMVSMLIFHVAEYLIKPLVIGSYDLALVNLAVSEIVYSAGVISLIIIFIRRFIY